MKTFTKFKTIIVNGRNRILYKTYGTSALYIKHKGDMIRYSEYKKLRLRGGNRLLQGGNNVLSAFDYYYIDYMNDEQKVKIADNFNAKFEELFDILNNKRAIQEFLNQFNLFEHKHKFEIVTKSRRPVTGIYDSSSRPMAYYVRFDLPYVPHIIKECYEKTVGDLKAIVSASIQKYYDKYNPFQIFASDDNRLIFLHKKYAIFMVLNYEEVLEHVSDDSKYHIFFEIAYYDGTIRNKDILLTVNKSWKIIFDNDSYVKKMKMLAPYVLNTNSSPRSSKKGLSVLKEDNVAKIADYTYASEIEYTNAEISQHIDHVVFS